uniref:HNH endonuclease signature motif containing protein n=1 Tax=Klebsiella pneumoniae TaxID=573 RepID=UPI003D251D7C
MNKQAIKEQASHCEITGAPLAGLPELVDVDRITERFQGGTYTPDNTRVLTPRAHMERHGILRERDQWL